MNEKSGIMNVFKPPGITSFGLLSFIKKLFKIKKAGHGGILDFMAQGVLPILVGEATKLTTLLFLLPKEYEGEITFGIKTDTDDIWGNVVEKKPSSFIKINDIENIKDVFVGAINQMPPKYSAKRISGKRAYELAKRGENVVLKEREVNIHQFDVLDYTDGDFPKLRFKILCSSGTYMRSVARDLGEKLGSFGTLSFLVRTAVGKLEIKDSFHIDNMIEIYEKNLDNDLIIPIGDFLDFIPKIVLPSKRLYLFRTGNTIKYEHPYLKGGFVLIFDTNENAVGIGRYFEEKRELKPIRILKVDDIT
ncbi:tRNA pseudouridine(55) synthase TruB [bacterium]|nr:tRNA pseudouridine(55) synthase TruB [bacterium]